MFIPFNTMRVTDRQTDRITVDKTVLRIAARCKKLIKDKRRQKTDEQKKSERRKLAKSVHE